ncbi:MAG: hypothetical protein J0I14_06910 [Propionibacteriaceae bacterium]|nr:hypothetical protein [Propionibacteriaceae bacterium]
MAAALAVVAAGCVSVPVNLNSPEPTAITSTPDDRGTSSHTGPVAALTYWRDHVAERGDCTPPAETKNFGTVQWGRLTAVSDCLVLIGDSGYVGAASAGSVTELDGLPPADAPLLSAADSEHLWFGGTSSGHAFLTRISDSELKDIDLPSEIIEITALAITGSGR